MISFLEKYLKRRLNNISWLHLIPQNPISRKFGMDRGMPIDRVYIENFLAANQEYITGVVCEISENTYSKKFGSKVKKYEILHCEDIGGEVTIVGDLANLDSLPRNSIDCFILTQTLNFIFDVNEAIKGVHYILKPGGVVLATVSGISQISRYDMDRWGDYWRFTDLSIKMLFDQVFGSDNVEVSTFGNALAAVAFMEGVSAEELNLNQILHHDADYQITIAVKAIKST
jgi:SAM-dependent methyltransferase